MATLKRAGTCSGTLSPCTDLTQEQCYGHHAARVTKHLIIVTVYSRLEFERVLQLFSGPQLIQKLVHSWQGQPAVRDVYTCLGCYLLSSKYNMSTAQETLRGVVPALDLVLLVWGAVLLQPCLVHKILRMFATDEYS